MRLLSYFTVYSSSMIGIRSFNRWAGIDIVLQEPRMPGWINPTSVYWRAGSLRVLYFSLLNGGLCGGDFWQIK